jgi:phage minor structural protein
MVKLFDVTDKTFSTNGDIVINPKKATIHKEDNGEYYLDLETDLSYINYLTAGKIIVANTPQGEQAFRITNPQKTRTKITIKAYHVYYDSANYLIRDSYVYEKNCNGALDHLNSATSEPSPFTTLSDVTTIASYRCVRNSLHEAITTVLQRWGGHLVRDNFNIEIRENIGKDNGVVIRYAKNLKEITSNENWSNVVTKLLPVGKDGILLNALDSTADVYVYSGLKYDIPYTKTVSFSQDKVLEDDFKDGSGNLNETAYKEALVQDLRQQAQNYVNKNCMPKISYTLKANINKITDIGDTVEVIDERLGINLQTHVIAFDYDCILGQYKQIDFGNSQPKLSNLVSNVTSSVTATTKEEISNVQVTLGNDLMDATNAIWGVLGDSYVIYEGDKILVVDNLPKETARNVLMINSGGIGFSSTGINGAFTSAWTIDGTLNMQAINVINLTADLIKGGTLKLGSNLNSYGQLEVYDEANNLIAELNKSGLKVYGVDHSYVLINENVGFAGYDRLGNKIYWCDHDEFHMKKGVMEEEITLCNKLRFIPITITDSNNNVTSDGIGLVSVATD